MNLEKVFKKVASERSKGAHDRALEHLAKAIRSDPSDFRLFREAAISSFELGNVLEGLNYLKAGAARFPRHREEVREICFDTFQRSPEAVLGNFLLETAIQKQDFEDAQALASNFPAEVRSTLLKRAQVKKGNVIRSLNRQSDARTTLSHLLYVTAFLYLAERDDRGYASSLGEMLVHVPAETTNVGKLLKEAERKYRNSGPIRLQLALAYLETGRPEHGLPKLLEAMTRDPNMAAPALQMLERRSGKEDAHPLAGLVLGEAMIRTGKTDEGARLLAEFLEGDAERGEQVMMRLEGLPEDTREDASVSFLLARALLTCDRDRDAVKLLGRLTSDDEESARRVLDWVGKLPEETLRKPEVLRIRAQLELDRGKVGESLDALGGLVEADRTEADWGIRLLEKALERGVESPEILQRLSHLYALTDRPGDAQAMLARYREAVGGVDDAVGTLSKTIIERCGVTLQACLALLDAGLEKGDTSEAVRELRLLVRERPDDLEELATEILSRFREKREVIRVVEPLLEEVGGESPPVPLRFLKAVGNLWSGQEEMAVFEMDQLLLEREEYRGRALVEYRTRLEEDDSNLTLSLALFSLLVDIYRYTEAVEAAARVLRLDPSQADHVLGRLEREVEIDESNLSVWEHLLTALLELRLNAQARDLADRLSGKLPAGRDAAVHRCRGELAVDEGRFDEALAHFEKALGGGSRAERVVESLEKLLAIRPEDGRTHLVMARALGGMQRIEAAARHFEKAAERGEWESAVEGLRALDHDWHASFALGALHLRRGESAEALRHFGRCRAAPPEAQRKLEYFLEEMWKRAPDHSETGVVLARLRAARGRIEGALAILNEVHQQDPETAPSVTRELLGILEEQPEHLGVLRLLIRIRLAQDLHDQARELVRKVADSAQREPAACEAILAELADELPGDPNVLLARSRALAACDRAGEALDILERFVSGESDSDPSTLEQVLEHLRAVDWPKKAKPRAQLFETDCLLALGRHQEASPLLETLASGPPALSAEVADRYDRLLETKPATAAPYLQSARLRRALGEKDRAVTILKQAGERIGDSEQQHEIDLALVAALREVNRHQEADEVLARTLITASSPEDVLSELEQLGSRETRRKQEILEARLRDGGLGPEERLELAAIAIEGGHFDRAREILGQGSFDGPWLAKRTLLLARLYMDEDRFALALNLLAPSSEEACDEDTLAEIGYLRAVCCERLGRWGEAYRSLADVLARRPEYRDADRRIRRYYSRYLEDCREPAACVLEKWTAIPAVTDEGPG
jgi:tetratricopeptide (TPR) repeat protein